MSEQLPIVPANGSAEATTPESTGVIRRFARGAYELLDTAAGISLMKEDSRDTAAYMDSLDESYDGALSAFAGRIAELAEQYPDWTADQIEQMAHAQLGLTFADQAEQDAYLEAATAYLDAQDTLSEQLTQLAEYREQRAQQMRQIGHTAVHSLVRIGKAISSAPYAVGAHITVAAMNIRHWYTAKSPEGKKGVWVTAAGVAVTGLATYIAVRLSGHSGGGSGNYVLAGHNVPETPDITAQPIGSGVRAEAIGSPTAVPIGHSITAEQIGSAAPTAEPIGSAVPRAAAIGHIPTAEPIGGVNLSGAHTSRELFGGSDPVTSWPDQIKVSRWNSQTKDGSLWGISAQILRRSGVTAPSDSQIAHLEAVLRPQAQPNGQLLRGQTLNLRPALDLLKKPKN